jgi:uncharacterized membrane protein
VGRSVTGRLSAVQKTDPHGNVTEAVAADVNFHDGHLPPAQELAPYADIPGALENIYAMARIGQEGEERRQDVVVAAQAEVLKWSGKWFSAALIGAGILNFFLLMLFVALCKWPPAVISVLGYIALGIGVNRMNKKPAIESVSEPSPKQDEPMGAPQDDKPIETGERPALPPRG